MASTNYINECKNDAYKNRLGKIEIAEKKATTGTSIKIEKGADSAIDLTLYGRSTQATRSGYNLVKNGNKFKGACGCATGITGSLTNEGYQQFDVETGNSNWTTGWFYSINQEIEENLSEGDTFTIMFTMRRTEGISVPPKIYIKNGMGYYSMIGTLSTEFSVVYYTGTWKDTNGIGPHLGFGGLTGTFIIKNWMIKKGGLEEWEDYGVMPSPDFPSPIESVERRNIIKSLSRKWSDGINYNLDNSLIKKTMTFSCIIDTSITSANLYIIPATGVSAISLGTINFTANQRVAKTFDLTDEQIQVIKSNQGGIFQIYKSSAFESANITDAQLEKGTVATDYVPYEHTEISATVAGKNIFNKNNLAKSSGVNKSIINTGVRATITVAGKYKYCAMELGAKNLLDKTITLNATITPSASNIGQIGVYFGNQTSYSKKVINTKSQSGKANIKIPNSFPEDCDRIWILFYGNTNGVGNVGDYVDYSDLMIVVDDTIDNYEEYKSNSLTIDLQGNELCSLPNGTKDEVNITNGEALLIKKSKKIKIDVSQIGTTSNYQNITYATIPKPQDFKGYGNYNSNFVMCTNASIYKSLFETWDTANNINFIYSSAQLTKWWIGFQKDTTLEQMKSSLANAEILYELAEPETINLGTVEMPHTYDDVSYITNSADTEMTVKAYEWTDEITNDDNLQSIQIDSGCYTDGNIIGSVYVECLNASFVAEATNLVDKIIRCQIGVKYADLSTEYICKGKYIIERPNNEITAQMSQITAYSDLYTNLEAIYICNLDYSAGNITLKDVYIDVCKQLGLTPLKTDFLNSTIPITDNPFKNNEKNRVVLQTISKIACSFVNVYEDNNQIDLCWLSENAEPDYTFEMSDYVSVEGGQVICGPINCLIIKNSQIDDENVTIKDDESIKANGEHSITISDDYILHNAELRQQAITSIWNRVKGLKYVDCKLITYYGKPFLKLGNKIRVYTSDTDYFDTYVLKHKFEYDGAFASTIESPALTEQEVKTKQDISLGKALTNVQIDLDKQKERITSTVTTTNALQDSVSNLSETVQEQANQMQTLSTTLTQTNQSLQAEVNQINESLENGVSSLKNKLVTIDINGIAVSTNTSAIKAIMNNDRFAIRSGDTEAFYVGYDENLKKSVSRMNDLTITDYFTAGYHRQEKFEIDGEKRTGWFYVGGE